MKKIKYFIACSLLILIILKGYSQGTEGSNVSYLTWGLKFGSCSSDQMYYSTQNYVNVFNPNNSGIAGVKDVYKDKFNYWGWQAHFENYSKNGYIYIGAPGLLDFLTAWLFDWPNKPFKFGKLKDFSTNFPQGTADQNLGGVYTDVFETRVAGGFGVGDLIYLKAGGQFGFGLQSSVANFDEQTGATFINSPGYRNFYGGNVNVIVSKDPQTILWRNTVLYNIYTGKANGLKLPGSGIKVESVVYFAGAASVGFYFQTTTMKGILAEPWLYGDNVFTTPKSTFTNLGFTTSFSISKGD